MENNQEARTGGKRQNFWKKKYIHLNFIYKGTALEGIQVEF